MRYPIAVGVAAVLVVSGCSPPQPREAGGAAQVEATDSTLTSLAPAPPRDLVANLRAAGLGDDLGGRGWYRSEFDGRWVSIHKRAFGANEVSCLMESSRGDVVELIELGAELYDPRQQRSAVIDQFKSAVEAVFPDPPRALMAAIDREADWSSGGWRLERDEYTKPGAYGLTLRWRGD